MQPVINSRVPPCVSPRRNLTGEEAREAGSIGSATLGPYFKAAGGLALGLTLLALFTSEQGVRVFTDTWCAARRRKLLLGFAQAACCALCEVELPLDALPTAELWSAATPGVLRTGIAAFLLLHLDALPPLLCSLHGEMCCQLLEGCNLAVFLLAACVS